ncbi:MAG: nucleotidyltransferase domain-containing protein [Nitrospinae bacterium]|nr:nucleotidyltransferase domain-containing protein [Nitrospinota bacterium]
MAVVSIEIEKRIKEAMLDLNRSSKVTAVYIFGSQINGTADEWSDVDIGVFAEGVENWDFERFTEEFVNVQIKYGHDLEPHFFPASVFDNPEPGSFAEFVKENGVRIDLSPEPPAK